MLTQEQLESATRGKKFETLHIGSQKCITAEFPLVSSLSIFIGMFKTYPVLTAYKQKYSVDHGAIIELYDFKNKKIRYIALELDSKDSNFVLDN